MNPISCWEMKRNLKQTNHTIILKRNPYIVQVLLGNIYLCKCDSKPKGQRGFWCLDSFVLFKRIGWMNMLIDPTPTTRNWRPWPGGNDPTSIQTSNRLLLPLISSQYRDRNCISRTMNRILQQTAAFRRICNFRPDDSSRSDPNC